MSTVSSKRHRKDEGGGEDESYLQNFLAFDTDKLAIAGRHDEAVLNDLEKFCDNLQTSLATVKKARTDEVRERELKQQAIQAELDRKARDKKTEMRKQLVAEKRCFQCNAIDKGLNSCVQYKHMPYGECGVEGVSGDGVIVCDDCCEQIATHTCRECSSFLHKDLGKDSCGTCKDDSYICKSCGEFWCLTCAEGKNLGRSCECFRWYCDDCADDNIETNNCSKCHTEEIFCNECSYNDTMKKCEGECEEPLCDECVCRLACGNDVRLCGNCEYDCCDCDMCEGYYGVSRWA